MWVMYEEQPRLNAWTWCCHLIQDNIFHDQTLGAFQQLISCMGKYLACLRNVFHLKTSCSGRAGSCTGVCSVKIGFPWVVQWGWVTARAFEHLLGRAPGWADLLMENGFAWSPEDCCCLAEQGRWNGFCSCYLSLGQGRCAEEELEGWLTLLN